MHVGLNLVYLVPGETGGLETYARELIFALLAERPGLKVTAFLCREAAADAEAPWKQLVPSVTIPVNARRRTEWVRGEQQLLPVIARRAGVDLVHSLASTAPAWGAFRRVVTIHDLIYRHEPTSHFGLRALGMRVLVPLAARRAHRIISPSLETKNDIARLIGVDPVRIDVVPNGVSTNSSISASPERDVRRRFRLNGRQILLTAAAKRPHKNLGRLLEALALIEGERRPVLVLPGYPTPHEEELKARAAVLGVAEDTRFLGWISAEDLEGLYRAAAAFVFPSLYEGFGLPLLEAMARRVPVACSDRPQLTEVAGDAASLFDPERPEAIAAAIARILDDPNEAERLRDLGLRRVERFSWNVTACATLASYDRAIAPAPERILR